MADPEIAIALCQQEREAAGRWFIAKSSNEIAMARGDGNPGAANLK